MDKIMEHIRTPYKIDHLVLSPSYKKGEFDSHAIDCPFPFQHDDRYYITFVGWDKVGYQTGLASSMDLVRWEKEGLILPRGPKDSITEYNAALTCIIRDNDLFGSGILKNIGGRFIGTYHAYPAPGYETGPAVIGLCYSRDLRHWEVGEPILYPQDGAEWESGGLYKSWVMEHDGIYYLFYNAKNRGDGHWIEQIGVAMSSDLIHWERYHGNPILKVGRRGDFDDIFASDPCVFQFQDHWIMFYYALCSDGHARNSVAFSNDLLNWTKSNEILIDVGPPGSIDSRYAHKPGIIARNGTLYHFYCAVSPADSPRIGEIEHGEVRGIALAHS
jgi:predicted GH43/DUF377 family glycosyl hydrolase